MSKSPSPESVLVTGASSGIGRALADRFARAGHSCILLARSKNALHRLADDLSSRYGVETHVIVADLSASGSAPGIVEKLNRRGLSVDVLVNNAGFGDRGAFAELSAERQVAMIQVNVTTLTELTHLLLPTMLDRDRGGILNVASTAAFQPGPYMSVYYATKAYVLSFSEGIAEETSESGVTVTCLAPGPTRTAFIEKADMENTHLFQWGTTMTPEAVAERGYKAFRTGTVLAVPGWPNKMGTFLIRLTPRVLARKLVSWLNR